MLLSISFVSYLYHIYQTYTEQLDMVYGNTERRLAEYNLKLDKSSNRIVNEVSKSQGGEPKLDVELSLDEDSAVIFCLTNTGNSPSYNTQLLVEWIIEAGDSYYRDGIDTVFHRRETIGIGSWECRRIFLGTATTNRIFLLLTYEGHNKSGKIFFDDSVYLWDRKQKKIMGYIEVNNPGLTQFLREIGFRK